MSKDADDENPLAKADWGGPEHDCISVQAAHGAAYRRLAATPAFLIDCRAFAAHRGEIACPRFATRRTLSSRIRAAFPAYARFQVFNN
jgi:hypothetical protein